MKDYSKEDILEEFTRMRSKSFKELSDDTRLIFTDMKKSNFGWSIPFINKIYIDFERLKCYGWDFDSIRGLLAHELAHQVSYQKRSFLKCLFFVAGYFSFEKSKRRVEFEADQIAVKKGYKKFLIKKRRTQFSCNEGKALEMQKRVYPSLEELEKLI